MSLKHLLVKRSTASERLAASSFAIVASFLRASVTSTDIRPAWGHTAG